MEENVQTEQILELDDAQLTEVTGAASVFGMNRVNEIMHLQPEQRIGLRSNYMAHTQADLVQTQIRQTAQSGGTVKVGKGWTKPLRGKKA